MTETPRNPEIHIFGEVSSTFDVAYELISEGRLKIWDSVLAKSQRSGRGQMRKRWRSPPGNVYASLRLPELPPYITSAAVINVAMMVLAQIRELGVPGHIKWPNDIVAMAPEGPRKLAGILIEEKINGLVAGIGVNLINPGQESIVENSLPAACIGDYLKNTPTPVQFWLDFINSRLRKNFSLAEDLAVMLADNLCWLNQQVTITEGEHTIDGIFRGINSKGGALLEKDGVMSAVYSGSMRG